MSKLSIDYKEKYLFAIFGKIQLQIFGKSFLEKGILKMSTSILDMKSTEEIELHMTIPKSSNQALISNEFEHIAKEKVNSLKDIEERSFQKGKLHKFLELNLSLS